MIFCPLFRKNFLYNSSEYLFTGILKHYRVYISKIRRSISAVPTLYPLVA